VSLAGLMWNYFGNDQAKTAESFRRTRWADESVAEPPRDKQVRQALAEAVAVVELGRTAEVRQWIAHLLGEEPSAAERWSRDLRTELRKP
jgi:hypothetical protein